MRRLVKIALVALGVRAFLSWRRRRKARAQAVSVAPPASDPAAELRQKLAENRTEVATGETPSAPEPTVEDRRAEVHEQARASIDDMKSSEEG